MRSTRGGRHLRLPDHAPVAPHRGPPCARADARADRGRDVGSCCPQVPPPRQGAPRARRRRRPRADRPGRFPNRFRPRIFTTATATARLLAGRSAPASRARSRAAGRCSPTAGSSRLARGAPADSDDRNGEPVTTLSITACWRFAPASRRRAEDLRGVLEAAAVRAEGHPRALERRVRPGSHSATSRSALLRERHPRRPGPRVLVRRATPTAPRWLQVLEHRRPACRQPLPDRG